jgi:hypothetical protein
MIPKNEISSYKNAMRKVYKNVPSAVNMLHRYNKDIDEAKKDLHTFEGIGSIRRGKNAITKEARDRIMEEYKKRTGDREMKADYLAGKEGSEFSGERIGARFTVSKAWEKRLKAARKKKAQLKE